MPVMYKQRVYSRRYSLQDLYMYQDRGIANTKFSSRNLLMEFIQYPEINWFIEQGIGLSVETFKVMETMEMQADLIATFTGEQWDMWREQKIIDKLQNSYNTNTRKEEFPF